MILGVELGHDEGVELGFDVLVGQEDGVEPQHTINVNVGTLHLTL